MSNAPAANPKTGPGIFHQPCPLVINSDATTTATEASIEAIAARDVTRFEYSPAINGKNYAAVNSV